MVPLFHFITCWRHSLLQLLMMSKQNRMASCMPLSMWVCLHLLACVIHRERHMCLSLMITNTYTQRYTNTHTSNTHTPPTAMPTQMCNNTLQVLREFHNTQKMLHTQELVTHTQVLIFGPGGDENACHPQAQGWLETFEPITWCIFTLQKASSGAHTPSNSLCS